MPGPYVTTVDPKFAGHMAANQSTSHAAALAAFQSAQRQWMYPPLSGWSGDPQDIVGMNQAFDRTNLNNLYYSIINDLTVNTPSTHSGTIGESMAVKLQIDYIAIMERAFRTRYCSSVRARLHSAARRTGHGDSTYGLFATGAGITNWLAQLIFAAHDFA
jgi:hypothetical protein